MFLVPRSLFLVVAGSLVVSFHAAGEEPGTGPFRPEPGKFPPFEKAHAYRGELVFVDHVNRRGSIRVTGGSEVFFQHIPQPFAMLPYGIVRYHGAPADLRNIPLGTLLHVRAFLPPDPENSAVPVVEKPSVEQPAENHVVLLEDEPSRCLREGKVWKLKEVNLQKNETRIVATLEPKAGGDGKAAEQTMTLDEGTRIWRGRECLGIADLIAEGTWPAEGKKALEGQSVQFGVTWKPTPGGVFTRFHLSDIWLDDVAMHNAAQHQTEVHKAFIRARWMPAWIDAVEYGKFGRATVTATLFGGMDASLYADLKPGAAALMNGAENTLKHTEGGTAGPTQMAAGGRLLEVTPLPGKAPLGSSGIRIRFETDLITEGMRPKRIVKVRPGSWPDLHLPREEYIGNGASNLDERFPTPMIFPTY
jgi:hypothetical protein